MYLHELHILHEGVIKIAREAGKTPRAAFTRPREQDYKGEIDLVTQADRDTEERIHAILKRAYPHYGIIAEEGHNYTPDGAEPAYQWFVDPIDGTTNFAHRVPHFSISIALTDKDLKPLLGVVYDPMRDECFSAYEGGGAFLNGERLEVSTVHTLKGALLATGFPYDRHHSAENNLPEFNAFLKRAQGVRRMGSAALDLAYVAAGRLDGYWEQKLSQWDCYAGIMLVREAGGQCTDYHGSEDGLRAKSVQLIASNGLIQNAMQAVIHE
ncbi:MAG: inositol monophosphatase family protein, partial [Anaerolineales bacterium]